jgi:hypothetical protein
MGLARFAGGGDGGGAGGNNKDHARDHESDQPLDQLHFILRSLDEKTALNPRSPRPVFGRPPSAMMFGAAR